jgi:hypothetical protein
MEIVVVGHLSRDLIITPETRREVLGGSTAYAMLAPSIGAFGAGIVSKVGLDFDENYKIDLISSGLNLSGLHYEGAHTTRFINEYDADGERTQRVEDLAHSINPSDFTDAHSEATIIHFSPLSSSEIDKACYDVAREEGALISLDVQGYLRRISDDGLVSPQKWPESDEILGMVDVVKLHDSELRTINNTRLQRINNLYPEHTGRYSTCPCRCPSGLNRVWGHICHWVSTRVSTDCKRNKSWSFCCNMLLF